MKLQLKRSNQLDAGSAKVPTASQLDYGELAVNYSDTDPAIFIKDSNDAVVRIAGNNSLGIDYVNVSGDNMSGNLTLGTDKITLNASSGAASFAGAISSAGQITLPGGGSGTQAATVDQVTAAQTAATAVANTAQGVADTANAAASAAQSTADGAVTDASTAQGTADSASTAASTAQAAADAAQSTADSASTAASAAQSTADSASTAASNAQGTANSASSAASTAQSTANSASTAASNAQSTANTANGTANAAMPKSGGTFTGNISCNGSFSCTGNITAYSSSDIRLKKDIEPIGNALTKVSQLRGVTYNWKDELMPDREAGVIAQEVQEVLPEITTEREDGTLAIRYERLVPLLIEAIKELQIEVNELRG